jgi:hypothetical protein
MLRSDVGRTLFAAGLFIASLAGFLAFWSAWPTTSSTSPLAALFGLTWGGTYLAAAILTWRRSNLAAPIFCAAVALLLFPAAYIVPGRQLFLPSLAVVAVVGAFGYWYLRARVT